MGDWRPVLGVPVVSVKSDSSELAMFVTLSKLSGSTVRVKTLPSLSVMVKIAVAVGPLFAMSGGALLNCAIVTVFQASSPTRAIEKRLHRYLWRSQGSKEGSSLGQRGQPTQLARRSLILVWAKGRNLRRKHRKWARRPSYTAKMGPGLISKQVPYTNGCPNAPGVVTS